jgi:predicted amino acid-binding ACT domain protein
MEDYFVMTMAADIAKANITIPQIHKRIDKIAEEMKLKITFQDETIFKMMHRV